MEYDIRDASIVMAALEVTPSEPADLTRILLDADARRVLLVDPELRAQVRSAPLVQYLSEHIDRGRVAHWHQILSQGTRSGRYRVLLAGDAGYPQRLLAVRDAPPILLAQGPGDPDPETAVAIVGSRQAPRDALEVASAVARLLAEQGVTVVSGMARGVDSAAHAGALSIDPRCTTAVIGTGIERVYPPENAELAEQIGAGGLILSQFAPGAPRTGTSFLRRNCVIAANSDASLLIDGRAQSGSSHQVEQASRYGRPVFLWGPYLAHQPWAQSLVAARQAVFVDSGEQLLSLLGPTLIHEGCLT